MTDLPMSAISTVPTLPTSETIIAGFTPDMSSAARIAAMLAAAPSGGEIALTYRLPNGRVQSYSGLGAVPHVQLLEQAINDATVTLVRPELVVAASFGDTSTGQGGAAMVGNAFTRVTFDTVTADPYKAFDPKTGIMTAPEDGDYLAFFGLRMADGDISGQSYGIGVDTVAQDSPWFAWDVGLPKRQGKQCQRYTSLKKGDPFGAFYYFDGTPPNILAAGLNILRVR
jgi:hypothetical protein